VALVLYLAEELAPTLRRAQLLGQLIATRLAIQLILGLVSRLGLGEDLPRDLPKLTVGLPTRVPARRWNPKRVSTRPRLAAFAYAGDVPRARYGNWQAVIEPLACRHTIVARDLRGRGGSASASRCRRT